MVDIKLNASTPEESDLMQRINEGSHSEADIAALRQIMRREPGRLSKSADLCEIAFKEAVQFAGGDNCALLSELLNDRREVLRSELGYALVSPAERLLIDEVALCRLRHYQVELMYTQSAAKENRTIDHGEYWEKRVAATQRRYLRAIETLARVGKLLRSVSVQLNIGDKQLNVATGNVIAAGSPAGPQPPG